MGMKLMAEYYHATRTMLDDVFKDKPQLKPLLTGASFSFTGDTVGLCGSQQTLEQNLHFMTQFLELAGSTLDVVTWHFYPGCSGCSTCFNEATPTANLFLQGIQ